MLSTYSFIHKEHFCIHYISKISFVISETQVLSNVVFDTHTRTGNLQLQLGLKLIALHQQSIEIVFVHQIQGRTQDLLLIIFIPFFSLFLGLKLTCFQQTTSQITTKKKQVIDNNNQGYTVHGRGADLSFFCVSTTVKYWYR